MESINQECQENRPNLNSLYDIDQHVEEINSDSKMETE